MIERFNATLLNMIAIYVDKHQRNWDENLALLTSAYRTCTHDSTGYSPNMLMLGRDVHLPIDLLLGVPPGRPPELETTPHEFVVDLHEKMAEIFQLVRQHMEDWGKTKT